MWEKGENLNASLHMQTVAFKRNLRPWASMPCGMEGSGVGATASKGKDSAKLI